MPQPQASHKKHYIFYLSYQAISFLSEDQRSLAQTVPCFPRCFNLANEEVSQVHSRIQVQHNSQTSVLPATWLLNTLSIVNMLSVIIRRLFSLNSNKACSLSRTVSFSKTRSNRFSRMSRVRLKKKLSKKWSRTWPSMLVTQRMKQSCTRLTR